MWTNGDHRNVMKTGFGLLFLLVLLQTGTEAQQICSAPSPVNFNENNEVGAVVTTITTTTSDVALEYRSPEFPFDIVGTTLVATEVLDFESGTTSYSVKIQCTAADKPPLPLDIAVILQNLNEDPPTFDLNVYNLIVPELTPIGTVVITIRADDPDKDRLTYSLTSSPDFFTLKSPSDPGIVVAKELDFDKIKTVQVILTVQDPNPLHTASTTVDITIADVDNRPPWFQPCSETEVEGVKICPNTGYTGAVSLGKMEDGPLTLKPNSIWAIDGDNGINVPIRYSLISGSEDYFAIGAETGNLTLLKVVDVTKMFHMTVMASQAVNAYQVATATLIINVVTESLHKPQFEKPLYEAVVEGVGLAMDAADKGVALKILATDQDYAAAGGINPNIDYTITGPESAAFSVVNGFLFMFTAVPEGTYNMQVKAEDMENFETAMTELRVKVLPEPTTTPPSTTISTSTAEPTSTPPTTVPTTVPTIAPTTGPTIAPTTGPTIAPTTGPTIAPTTAPTAAPTTAPTTLNPTPTPSESLQTTLGTPGPSVQTSNPVPTTEGTTGSTAHTEGALKPSGSFRSADMAALGASLGCLLFVCIVVIAVLAVKIRKGDTAWRKINEANTFRSSLGPSGPKEGVQFTNEAFQHDNYDKDDKDHKGGPSGGGLQNGTVPSALEKDKPQARSVPRPPSPIQDEEKEVKPILTKDKLKEDGYKAVWFKADIDPNAKEEVVIIPDSTAEDEEEEEERETKSPKVKFNDMDRDSGLGDKIEDSEEEVVTSNL